MKKKYKIQLPKGKKVTMTNVDFEDGVMTVNVELENKEEPISEAEKVFKHLRSIDWDKRTKESIDRIRDELYHKKHPETISNYEIWKSKFGDIIEQKYEPKDGDFIFVKSRLKPYVTKYSYIGIFHDIIKDDGYSTILLMYASLKDESRLVCGNSIEPYINAEYIRPATEAEKKLLIDKLAKANKRWNPNTKQIEDVRWRAKEGEPYSYLLFGDTDILVTSTTDTRMYKDDERFNSGNYFKTDSDAEEVAEQIREIFKNSKSE